MSKTPVFDIVSNMMNETFKAIMKTSEFKLFHKNYPEMEAMDILPTFYEGNEKLVETVSESVRKKFLGV